MTISDYEYPIEQCDVPSVRHPSLQEYRKFRRRCLEYLRGDSPTSIMNQIHDLAWYTVVFRTLNEARRLETHRAVNGALWDLTTDGYANLMSIGIRRLVDPDKRTDSLPNLIKEIGKRPELLRRENFVCYDGLPFDVEVAREKYYEKLQPEAGQAYWLPTKGPSAWAMSQHLHKAFDALCGYPTRRRRLDTVDGTVLEAVNACLQHPSIAKVCTMANRRVAHAERLGKGAGAVPIATYGELDEALKHVVKAANFLSSYLFFDATFGSIVPVPQFDVLHALDEPWVRTENLSVLHDCWCNISAAMDGWANSEGAEFLPKKREAGSSTD